MPDILKEIAERTKRSMSHEAGHALTAYDYGFGADEFLVEVANDPTGATYRGRIGLRFVSDEEIKKMEEAKRRCYGIVCAAGAAGEFVALGNIAQQNLHDESKDRQLLARFTTAPIEEFIEDAKIIVGGRREVHARRQGCGNSPRQRRFDLFPDCSHRVHLCIRLLFAYAGYALGGILSIQARFGRPILDHFIADDSGSASFLDRMAFTGTNPEALLPIARNPLTHIGLVRAIALIASA
jgi:hypothetical protein